MSGSRQFADKDFSTKRDFSALRQALDARLETLRTWRWSWWQHWRELAEYILPRRYIWLITPNRFNKGSPINQRIIDSTGTIAARTLAAGLMSGTCSPARPWFHLTTQDPAVAEIGEVRKWLGEVTTRMQQVMASSNYYTAKAVQYFDLVVFGTAPMIIYEDKDFGIRCFNPCAGEYFCVAGKNFTVEGLFREFVMSIAQLVDEFGKENLPEGVRQSAENASQLSREMIVRHAIEPNPEFQPGIATPGKTGVPRLFRFREVYWLAGQTDQHVLRIRGFHDQPFSCPRWDTLSNDAYGRSPCMDALGDVKQLQLEQKRKAQAIDKMVNPPMLADPSMKNEPASVLPGAVTYANSLNGNNGFRPVYTVMPPIAELKQDIAETQLRIKNTLFNDLFMMISELNTVRSATEIDARREEKLMMLGPVLERNDNEGLDPDIRRIYGLMARSGMLPPIPDALKMSGSPIKVSYVSTLADEQKTANLSSIERLFAFVGNLQAVDPGALDNLDVDEAIDKYAEIMRVPAEIIRDRKQVAAMRAQRQQQQHAAEAAQAGMAAVQGAQVLSQTDVGGGQNALQMALGNAAPAGNA